MILLGVTQVNDAKEITRKRYDELLGALPPAGYTHSNGFLVGEIYSHTSKGRPVYIWCYERNGKLYESLATIDKPSSKPSRLLLEFIELCGTDDRDALRDALNDGETLLKLGYVSRDMVEELAFEIN